MTDYTNIRSKINDLRTKVEHDSITPVYMGTMLDELTDLSADLDAELGQLKDTVRGKVDKSSVESVLSGDPDKIPTSQAVDDAVSDRLLASLVDHDAVSGSRDRVPSSKAVKDAVENTDAQVANLQTMIGVIDLEDIDLSNEVRGSVLFGTYPSFLKVTYSDKVVGVLLMHTDATQCQISQTFITNCMLRDNGRFDASHDDSTVFFYRRSLGDRLNKFYSQSAKWSDWVQCDYDIRNDIQTLRDTLNGEISEAVEGLQSVLEQKGVAWSSSTAFKSGALVSHDGVLYRAVRDVEAGGAAPSSDNADYTPLTKDTVLGKPEISAIATNAVKRMGLTDDGGDALEVADSEGNVILRADKDGIKTTRVEETDPQPICQAVAEGDCFEIADAEGNVILRADKDGIKTTRVEETDPDKSVAGAEQPGRAEPVDQVVAYGDMLEVADADGNVILRADKDGLHTTKLTESEPKSDSIDADVLPSNSDAMEVADAMGNVVARISDKGVEAVNISNVPQTPFTGKHIYVVGESLATSGVWAKKFAELTGAIYDHELCLGEKDINRDRPTVHGGGGTWGYRIDRGKECGGTQRFKNLVRLKEEYGLPIDVVFIINGNDANRIGPVLRSEYETRYDHDLLYTNPSVFLDERKESGHMAASAQGAIDYFGANIAAETQGLRRQFAANYNARYSTSAKAITITSRASRDGRFRIRVSGIDYDINVTAAMSIAELLVKIEELNFPGIIDTVSGNSITFVADSSDEAIDVSYADIDSGVVATVEDRSTEGDINLYYNSHDTTDGQWLNPRNWVYDYVLSPNPIGHYKGTIEWLQMKLPDTLLVWVSVPRAVAEYENLPEGVVEADGRINHTELVRAMSNIVRDCECLIEMQKDVCAMYGVPYADVRHNWGIDYNNAYPGYYYNNDVHCKEAAYQRWGETLARLMCGR